ncbi:uncharacterized protein LOC142590277 isoform X2 [Dermacentor variabilis]|uniref:uncharacterized protein LOC142590277 isoform X2 n=1 Tax=Dermacentor variabilis TaxID=34621 RepID=UPI003F5C19A8
MVAARCLSLVFLTVLCGVQDTGCEGKSGTTTNLVPEGCGDASATSTSTPATSTAPPKDYVPHELQDALSSKTVSKTVCPAKPSGLHNVLKACEPFCGENLEPEAMRGGTLFSRSVPPW